MDYQEMPLAVTGIHHYTLSVADIASSRKWYAEKLGFVPGPKIPERGPGKTAWLRNGSIRLQLLELPQSNPLPPYRSDPSTDNAVHGHKHFSLRITDGPEAEKELRALGVKIVFVPVVGETYGIFVCDPTGNLIEILQETRPSCPSSPPASPRKRPIVIDGWSHVAVSVPDTGAAIDWYKRVLGFPVAHSDSITSPGGHLFQITWLQGPDFSLELFEVPGAARIPEERLDPASDIRTQGNKYLSLGVSSLEKARKDLKGLGIAEIAGHAGETGSLFIRDNAGNLIEIYEELPQHLSAANQIQGRGQ
jgi:methylmalonyl-CoA/ethylmalonyl-CoA epimerase